MFHYIRNEQNFQVVFSRNWVDNVLSNGERDRQLARKSSEVEGRHDSKQAKKRALLGAQPFTACIVSCLFGAQTSCLKRCHH